MSHEKQELDQLIQECRELESLLPAQAAAGKILLFNRMLRSLESHMQSDGNDKEIIAARVRLRSAVIDFNATVFQVQHDLQSWTVGDAGKLKIGKSLHAILVAARDLETLVKERTSP